jgi:sialate O-acetylesterase
MKTIRIGLLILLSLSGLLLQAQVRVAHIFDSNMVLQRDKPVKVWGMADPSEKVTVEFGGQQKTAVANALGEWFCFLEPMAANNQPGEMRISGKGSPLVFSNVLVGDVWVLGGQSNMEFDLARIFHGDVEILSAHFPQIRLMTLPSSANLKPQKDFERINEYDGWYERYDKKGWWFICSPETVPTFSGMGYIFGKRLFMASQVPIGLIDISLGGTTVEAWLRPETLAGMPENSGLLKQWNEKNTPLDRNFPGSSYTGMVAPIAGLTVRGALFHQGYNNALEDSRPTLYALNFNALIKDWRDTFNDPDLPFGIIEFSAGGEPQTLDNFELRMLDPSPWIREGQFNAFRDIPNVGYVCAYDQQVNWYHPQKKVEAGERMARWALATQHGMGLEWEPAICIGVDRQKDRILLTFNKEVKTSDDRPIEGFGIAGTDRHFMPAKANYLKKQNEEGKMVDDRTRIELTNAHCPDPVEVRYAWARNPLGNLVSVECPLIPVPLFRTDTWGYPEAPYPAAEYTAHRARMKELRKQATELARLRLLAEAERKLQEK